MKINYRWYYYFSLIPTLYQRGSKAWLVKPGNEANYCLWLNPKLVNTYTVVPIQVAMFWAMEEANSPRGWDEEQELDYAEASRRRGERTDREGRLSMTL